MSFHPMLVSGEYIRAFNMAENIYKQTRQKLEKIVGREITKREFGIALGLGEADAARSVRAWEAVGGKSPRGLAAMGLNYLRQGLSDDLPEHMGGGVADGTTEAFLQRCRWPRFVGRVIPPGVARAEGELSARIGEGDHRLIVVLWIDKPMFDVDPLVLVEKGAAWIASVTNAYDRRPSEQQAQEQAGAETDQVEQQEPA